MAAATNIMNVEEWPSWGSRSVDCFEKLEQIGEGTYGQVYMAKEKKTGEIVALKKIRMDNEKEGFPITAIREIKILKKLQHENVINLKEIVTSPGRDGNDQGDPDGNKYKGNIYMVFEYMDHDLTGLSDRPGLRFTIPQIKCYMKQLLTGLHYCHVNQVLHRDIKGSNLLIDNEGNLKLADFGLARSFSNDVNANLTNRVITLWYRPPELLLGATKYGPAVDMWSVGCIFAELLYGKPILPGKNEYMDHDLTALSDRPGLRFTIPQIKCYMKQLLTGLHYCHVNQVLHRDIKGSNLLIDNEGNLKLADFGLARSFSNDVSANLTNRVITLWYRPPELLLGATKYGPAVDMWSVGCIFAELLYGKPILPGKNEPEQLTKIFELCGTPDEVTWPDVSKIPWYNKFKPSRPMKKRIRELFRSFDRHALDLLEKMLVLDPSQRISAKDALDAEYFWNDPLPCDPKTLPKYEASHEFQTKKKRQQQRQNEEIAKRQKLQHPQQHARLPPIQQPGQTHPPHWNNPSHPINSNPQPPMPGVTTHHQYGKPRGPPGGYYQDGGGYSSSGSYPSQGRGPLPGGYVAALPPNYSQSGRGQNPPGGGHRNGQYGWQQ